MHLNQRHERPPLGLVTVDDPRLLPLPRPLLLLLFPPLLLQQQRVHVDELGGAAAAGPGLRKWGDLQNRRHCKCHTHEHQSKLCKERAIKIAQEHITAGKTRERKARPPFIFGQRGKRRTTQFEMGSKLN